MDNHLRVGHVKTRLMIGLLSLTLVAVMAGQSLAATTCSTCHGMPPLDGATRDPATGAFPGNHQTHVKSGAVASDCTKCHNNAGYQNGHAATNNYRIQISPNLNSSPATATYSKGVFFNQTSVPVMGSCSNVNCHFEKSGGSAPVWASPVLGAPSLTTCATCHDALPTTASHGAHLAKYGNDLTACVKCHTDHTAEAKPFAHATSAGQPGRNITVTAGSYAGSNYKYLPSQTGRTFGNCSNLYCHSTGQSTTSGSVATPTYATPTWGNAASGACGTCHTATKVLTVSGSHAAHLNAAGVNGCGDCHTGADNNGASYVSANHVNNLVDVTAGLAYTAGGAPGNGYGTCSTASCHDNGRGVPAVTPTWGTTATNCTQCHESIPTILNGSHTKHVTTTLYTKAVCADCHNGAVQGTTGSTQHLDGNVDVYKTTPGDLGYPQNVAKHNNTTYSSCTTAYCHSSGQSLTNGASATPTYATVTWGGTAACGTCHPATKAATISASHAKHLTSTAQTIGCDACHTGADTNGASYNSTAHVNASIDVTAGLGYTAAGAPGNGYGTCSTASCHDNGTGTVGVTPTWGSAAAACAACHAVIPATASHTKHVTTTLYTKANCGDCHAGAVQGSNGGTGHLDTNIDVVSTTGYPQNKTKGSAYATCSTIWCHSSGQSLTDGTATPTYATVTWGGTAACGTCHPATKAATTSGSHTKHLTTASQAIGCDACHTGADPNGASYNSTSHVNSAIDLATGLNYSQGASHPRGNGYGTCSTNSCHSSGQSLTQGSGGTATYTTPTWGNASSGACGTCHPNTKAATTSGSHGKHLTTTVQTIGCDACHTGADTNGATYNSTSHVNSSIDVTAGLAYSAGGAANNGYGACSTVSCHGNGKTATGSTPNWGTTAAACTACHALQPATDSHTKHLSGLAAKFSRNAVCGDCHSGAVQGSNGGTGHLDGNVDVAAGTAYPQNKIIGSALGSCSTVLCHSNGRTTGYQPVTWGTTSTGCNFCHPTLGGAHGTHAGYLVSSGSLTFYNYTANKSPAATGTQYGLGCANCHPLSIAKHMDGFIDLEVNNVAGVGNLRAKNSASGTTSKANIITSGSNVTCDQVYCHSDGFSAMSASNGSAPNWYTTFVSAANRCAQCHGNSPNTGAKAGLGSPAHAAHVVGIHQDDIFNGTSGKLAAGSSGNVSHGVASRATSINCDICHTNTVAATSNDNNTACTGCHNGTTATLRGQSAIATLSFHVNGKADVAFKNVNVKSKAQIRPTSFSSYTSIWDRPLTNGYKVYSSSVDTAKKSLTQGSFTVGTPGQGTCANISCHNGYTVKWNDALTCESCHSRL